MKVIIEEKYLDNLLYAISCAEYVAYQCHKELLAKTDYNKDNPYVSIYDLKSLYDFSNSVRMQLKENKCND